MSEHEHDWKRWSRIGDGRGGYLIGENCFCGEKRDRPATPEETAAIEQEWEERNELHRLWHAFLKDTDGLTGFDIMEKADEWEAKHPDRIRCVTVDDVPHFSSSSLVLVTHENEREYMGATALFVPQLSGGGCEFFLYPSHVEGLRSALDWLAKRAEAKPYGPVTVLRPEAPDGQ